MALSEAQLAQLWVQAGGDPKYAVVMAKIAGRESGGRPGAQNLTYPDHSIGLWQINQLAHKGAYGSDQQLKDPLTNAKAAVALFKAAKRAWGDPMKPWSTHNAAIDAKYIGAKAPIGAPVPTGQKRTVTKTVPGVDRSGERASLIANYLSNQHDPNALIELAVGLPQTKSTPTTKITKTTGPAASSPAAPVAGMSGEYPLGLRGKIIGTPYSGTHTLGNWQSDNAVDIGVPVGTPMLAWRDGVVVKVSPHPQDGSRFAGDGITVRYNNGQEVFYKHGVSKVRVGQRVTRGTVLGTTGSANGVPHLHIGILKGNPLKKWG